MRYFYKLTAILILCALPLAAFSGCGQEPVPESSVQTQAAVPEETTTEPEETTTEQEEVTTEVLTVSGFDAILMDKMLQMDYGFYKEKLDTLCRYGYFDMDGTRCMLLLCLTEEGIYCAEFWTEDPEGAVQCIGTVELCGYEEDASLCASLSVCQKDGQWYLGTYIRKVTDELDMDWQAYWKIGQQLEQELQFRSEQGVLSREDGMLRHDEENTLFLIDGEEMDLSSFYDAKDQAARTYQWVFSICPGNREGMFEGYIFTELLLCP